MDPRDSERSRHVDGHDSRACVLARNDGDMQQALQLHVGREMTVARDEAPVLDRAPMPADVLECLVGFARWFSHWKLLE